MFCDCINLKEINFGNIKFSSVENMYALFYNCQNLASINLSNFDTSKVKNMEWMFGSCINLKYLDLSNFNSSNVNNIKSMFKNCKSLIYLNLISFHLSDSVSMDNAFDSLSSYIKVCANDENIKNILSQKGINNDCFNSCFKPNIKLDIVNNTCRESCLDYGYKYEFNNICYNECPEGSYFLSDDELFRNNYENISKCFDKNPKGYYLDIKNKIYKKCYKNCKYCYGEGNETINNCIECNDNLTIINNLISNTNCYEKCNYYYYFNESNNLQCTEICPENFKKLIKEKNLCIDKCENDDIHMIEYNNICYNKCPNGTYLLEGDQEKKCYNISPVGYYFDKENEIYKKCYEACNKCNIGGNISKHNCLECKDNYIFHKNNLNILNCYEKCNYYYYYYFNKLNEYHCTMEENCPEQYNKLIKIENKCIDDCSKDVIYKYVYKNVCYQECPYGTFKNETNYICYGNYNSINTDDIIKVKID